MSRRLVLSVIAIAVFSSAFLFLDACTFGNGAFIQPNSHFAYPNSNVTPIGHVHAKRSTLCGILFVTWNPQYGKLAEEAMNEAMLSAGGDLLINYKSETRMFMFPYLFAMCTAEVSGTAAKMEIGKQELH